MRNPLAENAATDPEDRELVLQAQGGNREALDRLVTRHQAWPEKRCDDLDALDAAYAEIHRAHPFHEPADFVTSLRALLGGTAFRSTLELEG